VPIFYRPLRGPAAIVFGTVGGWVVPITFFLSLRLVPEGLPKIAQRFIAGSALPWRPSPVGTAEAVPGFSRPYGTTRKKVPIFPAINRWAIFEGP